MESAELALGTPEQRKRRKRSGIWLLCSRNELSQAEMFGTINRFKIQSLPSIGADEPSKGLDWGVFGFN
jgi:hypothetical protein